MAAGTGKSGREVAEEHLQALVAVLATYRNKPLPRYNGELNRSKLAEECGFDRKIFKTNPRCAALIGDADSADRTLHVNALARAELTREDGAKIDADRSALEAQNLRLMAENASLRLELELLRRLERLMAATGRLPP